ncbi:MAG TPA: YdbH domain-containing protein [Sphingomicrobium sp.]|nr:YdbH domain-containing protein [Sphingomicrobium sp.]
MAERPNEDHAVVVRRGPSWGRVASMVALAILLLLVVIIAVVWIERRPIATHFLKGEFERRGVQTSYHLDRVGLRTQEVHDLVIGDPRHPDLVARHAIIQMRLKWNGSFEVYRVYARGVRLRGKLVHGKVSWGQVDKLLPPPSDKPFELPNFALDVADSTIALATPFGAVGVALQGNGMLSGGFKGRAAVVSPRLVPGRCAANNLRTNVAVSVIARRPHIDGPVTLDSFVCPASRLSVVTPRFDAKASFNESFTSLDGSGRMAISTMTAGPNGLAAFIGELTYKGPLTDVRGRVKLSAQRSRMGTIYADRTRLQGGYALGISAGTFAMVGDFAADSAALDPSMLAGVSQPLAAAAKTPIGPVASNIGKAITGTARNFNSSGTIRVVNFPGGGAARITSADIKGPNGARARVFGGSGVTYYWPSGGLRIDGNIEMAGGGLPNARISLRQPRAGAPMSGVADIQPYTINGTRLALTPIRFGPGPGGSTALSTIAQLDGPFSSGRVRALRLPIAGRIGRGGSFAFGTSCAVVSFDYLQSGSLQLGRTRLPICPIGSAMVAKQGRGPVVASARFSGPVLNGRLGTSLLRLSAAGGQVVGQQFSVNRLALRLGKSGAPLQFDASRLTGTFGGKGIRGNFSGAKAIIGNVPLLLSEGSGSWLVHNGNLSADSALTVSDRDPNPRFYPLKSNDVHFTLGGGYVRATGALRHPASGNLISNVAIEHRLSSGAGHADLEVPGLAFGPNFQPDELSRLTESVVALVNGTISGHGRIDWTATGHVTSTGDFSTANLDLAAPFGPVAGLSGTVHFNNLLGLQTPPGQVLNVRSLNPGILVENGVIRYQLLPNQLVKVERGEWPFMGGRLILRETVLNFARPTAKRLTFEVVGFDAKQFIDTLGFAGLEVTGKFNGVLPMIFDENGGRIVGGRLDSQPPGGEFKYTGTKPKAGMMAGAVFELLRDLKYRSMIVRLDGDLAGEFASRITIDQIALGTGGGLAGKLIRGAFSKVPLKLNLNISGPFRALIQMAKAFKDPRQAIAPVMPFPIDSPSLDVVVVQQRKEEEQKQLTPANDVDVSTKPPPSEK